jgi:hypothetical protein
MNKDKLALRKERDDLLRQVTVTANLLSTARQVELNEKLRQLVARILKLRDQDEKRRP